ncbi:MAG: acyl-CoA dehydrogenase family protein [Gemmatimonadota bacterium]|nr:acyl-CoA dehydrogenase family protein [Gemmatimonadota bacterium]
MSAPAFRAWPFFDTRHRDLAAEIADWTRDEIAPREGVEPRGSDLNAHCVALVRTLGRDGWLRHAVPAAFGGMTDTIDARSLCIIRETLAASSGIADFVFALQGLGAGPISLFGSDTLRRRYLPRVASGEAIPAFAISEADAGSDVGAMRTTARRDGDWFILDGAKTWISNAPIADFYVVFCRLPEDGERAYLALVLDAGTPGVGIGSCGEIMAPHSIGTLILDSCRVHSSATVGAPGRGMSVALGTLDVFRPTVGAAALGIARRSLAEALLQSTQRSVFGAPLADMQLTQAKLAAMATDIDASALLVYRAAWMHDTGCGRTTKEAAMAKWFATEAAQRAVDAALQLHGGAGVVAGSVMERLYREVRALRVYEGTSEIQQIVIAGQLLAERRQSRAETE